MHSVLTHASADGGHSAPVGRPAGVGVGVLAARDLPNAAAEALDVDLHPAAPPRRGERDPPAVGRPRGATGATAAMRQPPKPLAVRADEIDLTRLRARRARECDQAIAAGKRGIGRGREQQRRRHRRCDRHSRPHDGGIPARATLKTTINPTPRRTTCRRSTGDPMDPPSSLGATAASHRFNRRGRNTGWRFRRVADTCNIVPSERPTGLAGDDARRKQQRCGRSVLSAHTVQLHGKEQLRRRAREAPPASRRGLGGTRTA